MRCAFCSLERLGVIARVLVEGNFGTLYPVISALSCQFRRDVARVTIPIVDMFLFDRGCSSLSLISGSNGYFVGFFERTGVLTLPVDVDGGEPATGTTDRCGELGSTCSTSVIKVVSLGSGNLEIQGMCFSPSTDYYNRLVFAEVGLETVDPDAVFEVIFVMALFCTGLTVGIEFTVRQILLSLGCLVTC